MSAIQDFLHKLEVGGGDRHIKTALTFLLLVSVFLTYNLRSFQNLGTQEAMDAAQLARNIADGEGYTTKFIRPLSIYLHKQRAVADGAAQRQDPGHLKGPHPDISNAPVYPVLLAAWMKVMPFNHDSLTPRTFWYRDNSFWRHQPDFLIAILNQCLMVAMLLSTWLLTRRLFDEEAAWIATLCLLGIELLWKFSVSGLSTMLLLLLASGVLWLLHLLEAEARETKRGLKGVIFFSVILGVLLGIIALTRYSMLWLIIPVAAFLLIFGGRHRFISAGIVTILFALLLLPWIARNIHHSGLPFGTATHTVIEQSTAYPDYKLQRSLEVDVKGSDYLPARYKLMSNLRAVVQTDMMNLAGSWLPWFFVVGLMVAFRNPATQRLRFFILMAFVTLMVVQALGKTRLSDDVPIVNSENLLILMLPPIVMYGVAFFLMLLDNIDWGSPMLRRTAIVGFVIISSMPLLLTLAPPRAIPIQYPPYYPPHIQRVGSWMKQDELMMSDVPWAVAWYGNRRCLWLTLDVDEDFYAINDYEQPIRGLFLTAVTMDGKFVSNFLRTEEFSWGDFVMKVIRGELPTHFPLRRATREYLNWPEEIFLSDWDRWQVSSDSE